MTSRAELLKHSVRSNHQPHPRIVREVHHALVELMAEQSKKPVSTLKKISGIFARQAKPETSPVEDVLARFERAFIQPD
jgi:hypothetical protein